VCRLDVAVCLAAELGLIWSLRLTFARGCVRSSLTCVVPFHRGVTITALSQPGIELVGSNSVLWQYGQPDGQAIDIAPPTVEIDGQVTVLTGVLHENGEAALPNGAVEHVFECAVDEDDLRLRFILRATPDNPVVRFRYELTSRTQRRLTKTAGVDTVRLAAITLPAREAVEVRLSDYNSLVHSYVPTEAPLTEREFAAERLIMGPVLTWPTDRGHALLAYEHGSQYPDAYLSYRLGTAPDDAGTAELVGTKGTYLNGQDLRDQVAEEPPDLVLIVVAQPCAGQNLGVGHDRHEQSFLANEVADHLVRNIVKCIAPIEKADDRVGVEDYRHSSRSPSTRSRRSPPVTKQPE